MKENILTKALEAKKAKVMSMPQPMMERMVEIKKSEIPSGKVVPGQKVTITLTGTVKSVHDDGRVMLAITGVGEGDDDNEEEMPEVEGQDKKQIPMVRTQEEHG